MAGGKNKGYTDSKYDEALMFIISEMITKGGYTERQIVAECSTRLNLPALSRTKIRRIKQKLIEEWQTTFFAKKDEMLAVELASIDRQVKEAWNCFERSKQASSTTLKRQEGNLPRDGEDGKAVMRKAMQEQREVSQDGDPRWLDLINKLHQEKRKLLGLYSPERVEHSGEIMERVETQINDEQVRRIFEEMQVKQ